MPRQLVRPLDGRAAVLRWRAGAGAVLPKSPMASRPSPTRRPMGFLGGRFFLCLLLRATSAAAPHQLLSSFEILVPSSVRLYISPLAS